MLLKLYVNTNITHSRFSPAVQTGAEAISLRKFAFWRGRGGAPHGIAIRVYDAAGNVIETHEHARDFKEW
jgi:hypothetical protein